jgi:hypothetical protein
MRDMVDHRDLSLANISLIVVGSKKILYCRNADRFSNKLADIIQPNHIWFPALALKKRKQQKKVFGNEDLIVSGRLYRKDLHPTTYFTENKGAFIVSLSNEHPDRK